MQVDIPSTQLADCNLMNLQNLGREDFADFVFSSLQSRGHKAPFLANNSTQILGRL